MKKTVLIVFFLLGTVPAFATHFWWQNNGPESDAIRELNVRHVLWRVFAIRISDHSPVVVDVALVASCCRSVGK